MCGLIYILRLNDVIIKKIFGAQNISPFFNTSRSLFHIHIDRCGFSFYDHQMWCHDSWNWIEIIFFFCERKTHFWFKKRNYDRSIERKKWKLYWKVINEKQYWTDIYFFSFSINFKIKFFFSFFFIFVKFLHILQAVILLGN